MKARSSKIIYNPYDVLPGYGENSVSSVFTNLDLIVDIAYDGDSDKEESLCLTFNNVCFFSFSTFPGIDISDIEYEKPQDLGALIEYQDSDAAERWSKQLNFFDKIRHYQILFLSENKRLEVFATAVKITSNL